MNKQRIISFVAGSAFVVLSIACGDAVNTNTNTTTNANRNANIATPTPATTGGAYNRNYNSRTDFDKDLANYRAEAKNLGSAIGDGLEDGWIHFKVRAALAAVDDLRDSTINVDVDKNVVTLRGSVGSAAEKAAAEKAAKGVEGVSAVKNNLTIGAADAPSKSAGTNTSNTNAKSY